MSFLQGHARVMAPSSRCRRTHGYPLCNNVPVVRKYPVKRSITPNASDLVNASGPDFFDITVGSAMFAGIAVSALRLADNASAPRRPSAARDAVDEADDQTVVWSVMGVLSWVPFFDWCAWLFAAFESESPAIYYGFAALYALPWLHAGVGSVDAFAVLSTVLCGIHVQTERVAQTEADTLKLPGGDIQGTFLSLRDGTRDAGVRVKSAAAVTVAKLIGETKAIQDAESRRAEERAAEWEKEDFDRRLESRGETRPRGAKEGFDKRLESRGEARAKREKDWQRD